MSAIIQDPEGNDVEVFVRIEGGFVDTLLREDVPGALMVGAIYYELLKETDRDIEWVDGVEVTQVPPIILQDAVYGEDGEVITEAVVDPRPHYNMRIHGPALKTLNEDGYPKWQAMALSWKAHGEAAAANKAEVGLFLAGVTQIDPDTVSTPQNVWL